MLAIGLWSMAFGVRGILGHQLVDRHNDGAAIVKTFVQRHGDALTRQLMRMSFAVEAAALIAALLVLKSPVLAAVTLAYAALELFVYRTLRMRTAIVPPDSGSGERFKLALHSYYQLYLPLGILLQSSMSDPVGAVVALIAFLPLSLDALRRERDLLAEAVVRHYYPLQPVFDRPKRATLRPDSDGGSPRGDRRTAIVTHPELIRR